MSVTTYTTVKARNIEDLETAIATAIAAGKQPFPNSFVHDGTFFYQIMVEGSPAGSPVSNYDTLAALITSGEAVAVLAATGSTSADAAVVATRFVAVTGADGTKGVALPAAATDTTRFILNTGTSALKVYPVDGGNDNINSEAAGAAVTIAGGVLALFKSDSATQWYVAAYGTTTAAITVGSVTGGDSALDVTGQAAAQGGAVSVTGGASSTSGNAGGLAKLKGGAPGATGVGGGATLEAAAGGATSGAGGAANVTAGAGTAGNANGGSVFLTPGAKHGSGADGVVIERGVKLVKQGAQTAKTVSATLTAAEVLTGIITVNQGAAGASEQQLPLASAMDTALPDAAAGDAFDFSVINISTTDAEDASVTTNTGWTLVGSMDVHAYSTAGSLNSSARFRARKTGSAAWTLYRLA